MKWTSRLRRSSFETTIGHFSLRATESRGKLRPALKRVSALTSFDLGESIYDVAALGSGKPRNGITLGLEAKPRGALLLGADPDIGDDLLHRSAMHNTATNVGMLHIASKLVKGDMLNVTVTLPAAI
jgi:hypothetical protein